MRQIVNLAPILSKYLFWDMDFRKLSPQQDKNIIVPRASYATTCDSFQEDIERLKKLYTKKEILDHLKNTKELISNKFGALVCKRYHTTPFVRFKKR